MKNYLFLISLVVLFLTSCSDDEEPIHPIVGTWELDEITISEVPSGYQNAFNQTSDFTFWQEESYTLFFFQDGTYEREVEDSFTFGGDVEDEGEWEIDDEDLDLDQIDGDSDELVLSFTIDGEITERKMTLVGEDFWFVWPPEILNDPNNPLDTLETNEEYVAFFNEYGEIQKCTISMDFDKQ